MQSSTVLEQFYEQKYVVTLLGNVDEESIFLLCRNIDEALRYYFYQSIEIQLNSVGGDEAALEHYLDRLSSWRLEYGAKIATLGMIHVSSAAAVILSMGDAGARRVYNTTQLQYREAPPMGFGSGGAANMPSQDRPEQTSAAKLAQHIHTGKVQPNRINTMGALPIHLKPGARSLYRLEDDNLVEIHSTDANGLSYEQIHTTYEALFGHNVLINATSARKLLLVDEIIG